MLFGAVLVVTFFSNPVGPERVGQGALIDAGVTAFRAFQPTPAKAFDYRADTMPELARQISPIFLAADIGAWRLPQGWRLRGAQRAPGPQGEALLILLEAADLTPIGVIVAPLDSPRATTVVASVRGGLSVESLMRRGYGFAALAPSSTLVDDWRRGAGF